MEEKFLLKIAVLCSMAGILVLFLISDGLEINQEELWKISEEKIDSTVVVKGKIIDLFENNKSMIFEIESKEVISVVLFKENPVKLNRGDYVEVRGVVREYKNDVEIIGDEVRVIPK